MWTKYSTFTKQFKHSSGILTCNLSLSNRCRTIMKKAQPVTGEVSLRHLRYREKCGGKLHPPSSIELVVIGSGIGGSPRSLLVNTNYMKYLFNCGEATQRIVIENKLKLSRIDHIFITHSSWENIGGLMGMCLTLEGSGVPKVMLHGPPCAESYVTSARDFAQLRYLQLEKREISEGEYSDSAMHVEFVPIYSLKDNDTESPSTDTDENKSTSSCEDEERNHESARKKLRLTVSQRERNMSIVHVCKPIPKLRALSLEKCVEFKVPAGPLMGKLKEGKEVMLEDGQIVKPDDVLEPPEPNNLFIVVDCPSADYLESLVENKTLAEYQANRAANVSFIVHFTPSLVMQSSAYQNWLSGFGPSTKHLVLNDLGSELCLSSVYALQAKLNLLHPGIFPLLPHQLVEGAACRAQTVENNVVYGETNLRFIMRGHGSGSFNRDQCLVLNNDEFVKEACSVPEFKLALEEVHQRLALSNAEPSSDAGQYPEILFLGTGSAMPSKVRNVSAIWVNLSDDASVLLDCGENTYGQLYRHYGKEKMFEMMSRLRAVFVSHLHADHHMGLPGIALERFKLLSKNGEVDVEPLIVVASGPLEQFYHSLNSSLIPISSLVRVMSMKYLYPLKRLAFESEYVQLIEKLGLKQIQAVRVLHRQYPHAVILEHASGWKLAYSGDTMPCQDLIEAARGCSILIHEATMEDELVEDAREKKHSTASQAIDVGIKMGAEFILLTHFSQRYPKIPIFNDNFSNRVGIAFDNMRVRHCDLKLLPLLTPALKAMFAEAYTEMEDRTKKRQRVKQWSAANAKVDQLNLTENTGLLHALKKVSDS